VRDESSGGHLVFALDSPDLDEARRAAHSVGDAVDMLKVGLELFVEAGPLAVGLGAEIQKPVFLDLKLHDIPETVERAVARASTLGVKVLTVHASGGAAMLERAVARAERDGSGLRIAAVTVLTSLDDRDLSAAGITVGTGAQVKRLAKLAWQAGVRTFVCSAREVGDLRALLGAEAVLITPGIRAIRARADGGHDDQKRVATATDAILDGADWLVVGRPIRDADDPRAAARAFQEEIASALAMKSPPSSRASKAR
jgi:orotidine-5'-phosphate decarboxylase